VINIRRSASERNASAILRIPTATRRPRSRRLGFGRSTELGIGLAATLAWVAGYETCSDARKDAEGHLQIRLPPRQISLAPSWRLRRRHDARSKKASVKGCRMCRTTGAAVQLAVRATSGGQMLSLLPVNEHMVVPSLDTLLLVWVINRLFPVRSDGGLDPQWRAAAR